jgi:transposase-like protein
MPATHRRRRPIEERREIVRRWIDSGLAARAFAEQADVSMSSLHRWRSELARSVPSGFVELSPRATAGLPSASSPLELVIDDRLHVRVPVDFDEAALRRLLVVLGCAA